MKRVSAALSGLAALLFVATAASEENGVDVTVSCERKPAKGRVLCDVELEAPRGKIAWADVLVVEAPAFAPPLRSRVALGDERSRTERRVRIPVAFVAKSQGRGNVELRGRAVVCVPAGDAESCSPAQKDVKAELVVGIDVVR
jgi:hypothetical protein